MITREQRRMQLAWQRLNARFGPDTEEWKDKGKHPDAGKYLGALKKTPARIHACGLGMAVAFPRSRKGPAARDAAWDVESATLAALQCQAEEGLLLRQIAENDASFLFLATDEAVAVIAWMTRLMEGAGVETGEDEA